MKLRNLFGIAIAMSYALSAQAATKNFVFNGQTSDELDLSETKVITQYKQEPYNATCSKEVPYVDNECGYVTDYKIECHTVPGHNQCHTENKQVCNNQTYYETECHAGPMQQQCSWIPPKQQCHPGPMQQVCHPGPMQQVCHPGPMQQVCHQGPPKQQCHPGPMQQVCHPGPAQQVCHQGPPTQQCNPGPMQQVCHQGPPTQKCTMVPGQQVCKTIPAHEECKIVNGRKVCMMVPAKQECHAGPATQQCHQVPGQQICEMKPGPQQCHTVPGQQICTTKPGPQVCEMKPGPQQCTTVPGQQICEMKPGPQVCTNKPGPQVCEMVPGPQQCNTIPGHNECNNVPGPQVCQQVPHTKPVCTTQPQQVCQWIPPREVCENVPFQKHVCKDVTKYKTEYYSCTKYKDVPYQTVTHRYEAKIRFEFDSAASDVRMNFNVTLNDDGRITLTTKDQSSSSVVAIASFEKDQSTQGDTTEIDVTYKVHFENRNELLSPISQGVNEMKFDRDRLKFEIGKVYRPSQLKIRLNISDKKGVKYDSVLTPNDYTLIDRGSKSEVFINLKALGLSLKWRYHTINLQIEAVVPEGDILGDGISSNKISFTKRDFAQ